VVLRTISWQFLLSDNGMVLGAAKTGACPADFHCAADLRRGDRRLTYNYLPFMVLPIYVALERVDPGVVEASYDLYSSGTQSFLKVILPRRCPGCSPAC